MSRRAQAVVAYERLTNTLVTAADSDSKAPPAHRSQQYLKRPGFLSLLNT